MDNDDDDDDDLVFYKFLLRMIFRDNLQYNTRSPISILLVYYSPIST